MSNAVAVQETRQLHPHPAAVNDARAASSATADTTVDQTGEQDIVPLSGEVFGALINLSGRRRFTSQRLVLYAVLGSQGHPGATAVAREALALFRGAHTSLLKRSGELPGVFCPELEEIYFGAPGGDARITGFAELAGRALNAIDDKLKSAPELLAQLVKETTPLLAVLNQITGVYEEQSKKHARLMRNQLRGIMTDIETIAREAKMVAFNARIVAARSGQAGKEFSVVAGVLSSITGEIDELVKAALSGAAA
ncbi:methyl-accepting chemotaxis protein [Herbaspirillum sp. WKF16]|uniref:methyl-accepting chemotaxis protein n=1 Tax=Herbaspirillum sp. WKF16 TaxID=3028312 RepID=UPI0023A93B5C|nr:methyl-accepting chemotaxis protein [Herbaspirillum sp. WKF16]WDZ97161.1 methyl-accepting chemotaxis protein [Herbaspirillum sp. WKF16]